MVITVCMHDWLRKNGSACLCAFVYEQNCVYVCGLMCVGVHVCMFLSVWFYYACVYVCLCVCVCTCV